MEEELIRVWYVKPQNENGYLLCVEPEELICAIDIILDKNEEPVTIDVEQDWLTQEEIDEIEEFKGW